MIQKTATLTDAKQNIPLDIFRPLEFRTESVIKVACEPVVPSELPKMLEGLRMIGKSYPLSKMKVEESGEHIIYGTGELYMDQVFHDLRKIYTGIEVKISEPFVSFTETVSDASSVKCFGETPNKKNQLSFVAEPLEKGISEDVERGLLRLDNAKNYLVDTYGWDKLTAYSVWAFGPNRVGPNTIIDYSIGSETDKKTLAACRDSIV